MNTWKSWFWLSWVWFAMGIANVYCGKYIVCVSDFVVWLFWIGISIVFYRDSRSRSGHMTQRSGEEKPKHRSNG